MICTHPQKNCELYQSPGYMPRPPFAFEAEGAFFVNIRK